MTVETFFTDTVHHFEVESSLSDESRRFKEKQQILVLTDDNPVNST